MQMQITQAQANRLLMARNKDPQQRSAIRKAVYAEVRAEHGISPQTKLRIAVESPSNPMYLVIRDKYTGIPLDNGIAAASVAVNSSPVHKPEVKQATAKKAVKAPSKKSPAVKSVKVDDAWPRNYRVTIGGKRVRLGEATSAAHAKKLVAKYKKQHGIE
jgi:hypothetical protein